jgi:hypothetical protein
MFNIPETDKAFRPCSAGWQYCDGQCTDCGMNNTTYGTSTSCDEAGNVQYRVSSEDDGISKPTKEQYEKSKQSKHDLSDWIRRSRKRQDELLDELFRERAAEKDYKGMYEAHRDLVRRYELYEEIESNG